ncbi:MAG: hypothetical protein ACLQT7_11285 [Candidatus Dormibacteria bacterium]
MNGWTALGATDPSGVASALISVHQRLGYALLVVLVVGVVLAALAARDQRLLPTARSYLWLAFAAVALQGVSGVSLLLAGQRPAQGLHVMYGPLTFIALPLTVLFARGTAPRREAWMLTAGFVVALLLAFRAISTG